MRNRPRPIYNRRIAYASAHAPAGLAPFFHQLQGMGDQWFQEYNPSRVEMQYQRLLQNNVEESLDYRRQYEHQWEFAARRFNLLAEALPDSRMSNILIPIIKIVIMARMGSMTRGEMDVTYIPGQDDDDKVELWKDCRRYVNNKCNYRREFSQSLLSTSLFGSGVMYDGYRSAYQTVHVPDGMGRFKETVVRDPRNSMIFTESVMPWHYLVSGGGRGHFDAPHYTLTRFNTYDKWVSEFARTPGYNGKPLYMHTRSVKPGEAWRYEKDRSGNMQARSHKLGHQMVCTNYHWIPTMNLHMIESNGVLNWCGPNPYKHGRGPFSMLKLHPQMDPRGGQFSIYGQGDAWLLSGLDTLYQSVMNMFVDNFYFSNSSVIGVPQGLNLDIDDEEFYGGTVIRGAEKMIVSQLGRVDGQSYNFMWQILNDLIMWACGVPFNQLTGGQNVTAYELAKKVELSSDRQRAILKDNESDALKNSEEMKISNIFQFLPQEEFYAATDPDAVEKLVEEGKIAQNDIVYEDGIPIMVRSFPMIETKGRVIEEKFVNNFPVAEGAKVIDRGRDGRLPARPEYIRSTEWFRNCGLPDVQIDSATAFGPNQEFEKQNTIEAGKFAIAQNDRAFKMQKPLPFNEEKVNEDVVRVTGKNPREWMKKDTDEGTIIGENQDTRETAKNMRKVMDMRDGVAEDSEPPMPPDAGSNPADILAGGPQTQGAEIAAASSQLNASMGAQPPA